MIERHPITTLFLDIGGVLLSNTWDQTTRKLASKKFNLDYEELNERHHLTFDTYEEGKLSLKEYLNRVVFYKERPFSQEEFRDFIYAQSVPYPKMIDLMRELKNRYNLQVAAVSNEGREFTMYRVQKFDLRKFIDFFISSCFVHIRKPDEDLYRIALDTAQVRPDQVIYIDDRSMFVEVARKMGIEGIVQTDYETTRSALEKFGLSLSEGS